MRTPRPQTTAGRPGVPGRRAARDTHPRSTLIQGAAALAATLLLALALATGAHAGEWVQVSCINPNQTAAGSGGWSTLSEGAGQGSEASSECGPGSYAQALLATPVPTGAYETLDYTPPSGSTLNGGLLDLALSADGYGPGAWGTATAKIHEAAAASEDILLACAVGYQACGPDSNDYIGQLEIPTGHSGHLHLEAGCAGAEGDECQEGGHDGAVSQVELWWAELRLTNTALPTATGIGGSLLTSEDRGTRELQLIATERKGPGIYNITVQAEGQTLYNATPDSNDGQCVPVGDSDGALMFDSSQPCKANLTVDLPIETTVLHDGSHTLEITISDPAGNTAIVYENTITTHNAPEDTSPPTITEAQHTGGALTAQHGDWQAPEHTGNITYSYSWQQCNSTGGQCTAIPGAEGNSYTPAASDSGHTLRVQVSAADNDGTTTQDSEPTATVAVAPTPTPTASPSPSLPSPAPAAILTPALPSVAANGVPSSQSAQLQLSGTTRITRSYANRAVAITGQLTTTSGEPIADATLEVDEQAAGSSTTRLIARASTTTTGAFTINAPAGPSRTITIGYRPYSSDPTYAAQATLHETVTAGVQLHVTPHNSTPTGTITLAGQVAGPIPHAGITIVLLVRYHGQWQPFRDPHTDSHGHFHIRYQFQGAEGRFPFRAEALSGQSGFPYATGQSNTVTISTG